MQFLPIVFMQIAEMQRLIIDSRLQLQILAQFSSSPVEHFKRATLKTGNW